MNQLDSSSNALPAASKPARLGRYEVAGLLATGGMAEIWLGRLTGPFGFERVVVCKRIFPHLARRAEFVNMFVDEARIASGIQHPNVVTVHELVQDSGELFLVMEYLAGESLGGLLRRLASRGERLPSALAAHIVGEACAGLHAAHELTDEQGFPRDLVHRDISPQNLFITYSGQVKLLDFGIAKAADRVTETEAGQVKGKFAYMSPEQCQGKSLDRRSDVFSMGIVLWEALSGGRLFARSSELLTFQAICDAPTPPLQGVAADDAELQRACDRALAKPKQMRFSTALELRSALQGHVRRSEVGERPEQALEQLMQRLFPERIEAKRQLLLELKAGSLPEQIPSAEVDEGVTLPTLGDALPGTTGSGSSVSRVDRALPWTRGLLVGTAIVALIALSAWFMTREGGKSSPANIAPTSSQTPAPRESPAATENPGKVHFYVATTPEGALLALGPKGDLRTIGRTPTSVTLPRADTPLVVELSLPGYQTHRETLIPNMSQRLAIALQRESSPQRPRVRTSAPSAAKPAKPMEPKPIPRFR
ncbi:MAG: protein kinase [Myxococcales bacterium]|nr:protein kinase [Myxococcales bacterium]